MATLTIKKTYTVTYHVEELEDNGSQVGGYFTSQVGKSGLTIEQAIQLKEYSEMMHGGEDDYYIVADVEQKSKNT